MILRVMDYIYQFCSRYRYRTKCVHATDPINSYNTYMIYILCMCVFTVYIFSVFRVYTVSPTLIHSSDIRISSEKKISIINQNIICNFCALHNSTIDTGPFPQYIFSCNSNILCVNNVKYWIGIRTFFDILFVMFLARAEHSNQQRY